MPLFQIAVLPPQDLTVQIDELRLSCSDKFGVMNALRTPVQISLFRPVNIQEALESKLCNYLQSMASGLKPFTQELENFEAFTTQAVVIRALKNPGIMALQRSVSSIFQKNEIEKTKDGIRSMPFRPHINLAYRDVLPEVFPMIWHEYKDKRFKRKFTVDKVSLLRHDGEKWNTLRDFKLSSMELQPELFSK